MAYVTPGTVAAGDVATAAAWNVLANDVLDHETRILLAPQVIQTVTLTSDTVVTFSSIPQTYTSLKIVLSGRANIAATVVAVGVRFNDDSGSNYPVQFIQVNNTTVSGGNGTLTTLECIVLPAATATAGIFGAAEITIPAYRVATVKSVLGFGSCASATAAQSYMRTGSGYWNNTAAITKISFSETMVSGTKATLIGIP